VSLRKLKFLCSCKYTKNFRIGKKKKRKEKKGNDEGTLNNVFLIPFGDCRRKRKAPHSLFLFQVVRRKIGIGRG
jgi:hypothetical protein